MISIDIDRASAVPLYRQIMDAVLAALASGRLRAGERLPPIRSLAASLAVNANTVVKAYAQLQAMGAVDLRHGAGVFARPPLRARQGGVARERQILELCREFAARGQRLGLTTSDLVRGLVRLS